MKLVKQFNDWSCAFACIESFLVDNDRPFSHEVIVSDPARPIIDGEGNIGGYSWSWQFGNTLAGLLLGRGLKPKDLEQLAQPTDLIRVRHVMRKMQLQVLTRRVHVLNLDVNPLRDFGSRFGFDVLVPKPLIHPLDFEVFPSLPEGETYLILAANFAYQSAFHCLRSNGETCGDRLIVMNPIEGIEAGYPFSLMFEWKSFFVPLRLREGLH